MLSRIELNDKKHLALLSLLCIDDQDDLQNSNEHNGGIKDTSEEDKRQEKVWTKVYL